MRTMLPIHGFVCLLVLCDALIQGGYRESDSVSGASWSSILTGVWANKHGVHDNTFQGANFGGYPHFFRAREGRPARCADDFDGLVAADRYPRGIRGGYSACRAVAVGRAGGFFCFHGCRRNQHAGRLVSILTGIFGVRRLQLAEGVVQEAMARALRTWPFYGVPENPTAWLMRTARHPALDAIRREKVFREKEPKIALFLEQRLPDPGSDPGPMFETEIRDDRPRLLFACCHPVLPWEMQTTLGSKVLGGLGAGEIARAFLTTEAADPSVFTKPYSDGKSRKSRDRRWNIGVTTNDERIRTIGRIIK